jgi:predicted XRE-type DNA-binding protein
MRNGKAIRKKSKPRLEATDIEPSSGNVFADLGLPRPELALTKAKIVHQIGQAIAAKKLSQAKVAAILDVDQPKISGLLRGRFEGFSLDRLLRFLNALGSDVEIVIRPAKALNGTARTRVIVA